MRNIIVLKLGDKEEWRWNIKRREGEREGMTKKDRRENKRRKEKVGLVILRMMNGKK